MSSKNVSSCVFPNDITEHCVIDVVWDTRIPKSKPCLIEKCNMKKFVEQAFLYDLCCFRWDRFALFDDSLPGIIFMMFLLKLWPNMRPLVNLGLKGWTIQTKS